MPRRPLPAPGEDPPPAAQEGPESRAPSGEPLKFRTVRVRPTSAGLATIFFLLAAGVVAVNAGNNLLYLVIAGLLSLLVLSGILALANLRGLRAGILPPGEIYALQPATVRLRIANVKRRLPSYLLACGDGTGEAMLLELLPSRSDALALTLRFEARGRQPYPPLLLTSSFPFGLVRRGGVYVPGGSCLVYPRPQAVAWELIERAEREGEGLARREAGTGGDYRGLREYVPGDSPARIQWKSWLRQRRLQTKEFEAEGGPPVTFAWEGVPGPGVEDRLGQLTWLVRTAFRRGRSVGLVLPHRAFPAGTGAAHRRALLAALALFGEEP